MKSSNDLTRNVLLDQLCDSLDQRFPEGKLPFSLVTVRYGQDAEEAVKEYMVDSWSEPQFMLVVNTHHPGLDEDIDQEIEKTIEELLKAGVSREEIDKIIAGSSK